MISTSHFEEYLSSDQRIVRHVVCKSSLIPAARAQRQGFVLMGRGLRPYTEGRSFHALHHDGPQKSSGVWSLFVAWTSRFSSLCCMIRRLSQPIRVKCYTHNGSLYLRRCLLKVRDRHAEGGHRKLRLTQQCHPPPDRTNHCPAFFSESAAKQEDNGSSSDSLCLWTQEADM